MTLMTLSTKDAEIERLRKENEEYHFICNMTTEHGMSMSTIPSLTHFLTLEKRCEWRGQRAGFGVV
jgi:hypothetical protein